MNRKIITAEEIEELLREKISDAQKRSRVAGLVALHMQCGFTSKTYRQFLREDDQGDNIDKDDILLGIILAEKKLDVA